MISASLRTASIVATCVLLLFLSGCTTPHRTLYGVDVIPVTSIQLVLGCEFKGTFTATVFPGARLVTSDMDHPANSEVDRDLLIDARNLAHEILANRILWRSIPFKGSRRFDAYYCRKQSTLSAYSDKIKAKCLLSANLLRLCTKPGSAQSQDFEKYCSEEFQPNFFDGKSYAGKFSVDEKIDAILARLFKKADTVKSGDIAKYCQ